MKQEDTFLLKRWRDNAEDDWHFSLKDIYSGEIRFFSSPKPLAEFLQGKSVLMKSQEVEPEA